MTKRRVGALAGVFLLLLVAWSAGGPPAAGSPAAPRVDGVEPAHADPYQTEGVGDDGSTQASRDLESDDDFAYDTGASVRVQNRGLLRVESWRDDGTPDPQAIHRLNGCDRWRAIGTAAISRYRVEPGRCVVEAWRTDGRVDTPHQFAEVEITLDEEATVSFTFPSTRAGSVGVEAEVTEAGAELLDVLPGSPADEAGLEPGDRVVAVDCVEVAGMSDAEYLEAISGPEGTAMNVTVAFAGDTGLVEEIVETTTAYLPFD